MWKHNTFIGPDIIPDLWYYPGKAVAVTAYVFNDSCNMQLQIFVDSKIGRNFRNGDAGFSGTVGATIMQKNKFWMLPLGSLEIHFPDYLSRP